MSLWLDREHSKPFMIRAFGWTEEVLSTCADTGTGFARHGNIITISSSGSHDLQLSDMHTDVLRDCGYYLSENLEAHEFACLAVGK